MSRRTIGTILAVVGALLLLDVVLTVTWREPVTWLLGRDSQSRLSQRLDEVDRSFGASIAGQLPERGTPEIRIALAAQAFADRARAGEPLGRIEIPAIGERAVVIQGTGQAELREGPGHYEPTSLPGQRGTVGIAGHRTTWQQPFRHIDRLRPGDRVTMTMAYGRFTYLVEKTRVVAPSQVGVLTAVRGRERIVLTACHPLYSAAQRIVVFARLSSAVPLGVAA
ncbi:MAG: class E sortase [Acidobacteria bacterium]|nr:class E sortase [Acidobacteriota bacterium]